MVRYSTYNLNVMDNGQKLRKLIEAASVTQVKALDLFNKGQARPLTIGQWKAYLAAEESTRRSPCPDAVLEHAKKVLKAD